MVDPAGNLYYDTGEQKLGFYMVRHPISPVHMLHEGSATCLDKYAGQNEQKKSFIGISTTAKVVTLFSKQSTITISKPTVAHGKT